MALTTYRAAYRKGSCAGGVRFLVRSFAATVCGRWYLNAANCRIRVGTMGVHVSNWTVLGSLLSELLPAKYTCVLPAVCGIGPPSSHGVGEGYRLMSFVTFLVWRGKIDQLNGFVDHTGFNFMDFICTKIKNHKNFPVGLARPLSILALWHKDQSVHNILNTGPGKDLPFTAWMCEQVARNSPSKMRDIFITFILAFSVGRPDNVDHALKVLPMPWDLCEDLVRDMVRLGENQHSTSMIRKLVEGVGLSGAEFLRGCQPSDVLRRHCVCERAEDGEWLLHCASDLSEQGAPWLLTAWHTPKIAHNKCFTKAVLDHLKLNIHIANTQLLFERRFDNLVAILRKTLPPDFKASEDTCIDFLESRWLIKFDVSLHIKAADRLLGVMGFDLKTYLKEEFRASHLPKYHREMRVLDVRTALSDGLSSRLLLNHQYHLGVVLDWVKTFLAPSDIIYPDGFSCILPTLATSHTPDENASIHNFLKAMGYTTSNERKHGWPTKRFGRSHQIDSDDILSRIPGE